MGVRAMEHKCNKKDHNEKRNNITVEDTTLYDQCMYTYMTSLPIYVAQRKDITLSLQHGFIKSSTKRI